MVCLRIVSAEEKDLFAHTNEYIRICGYIKRKNWQGGMEYAKNLVVTLVIVINHLMRSNLPPKRMPSPNGIIGNPDFRNLKDWMPD